MNKSSANKSSEKGNGLIVKVSGTSPLSFSVDVGTILQVREISPSSHTRPTLGSGFKSNAYLLFTGRTKVGNVPQESLEQLGAQVPKTCTVCEVNRERKMLFVTFG